MPEKEKETIQVQFRRAEGGGVGEVVKFIQATETCPRKAIKEAVVAWYAPLAVPAEERGNILNQAEAIAAIYRILAQAAIVQDLYGLNVISVQIEGNFTSSELTKLTTSKP